jgi:hypothetical protein
VVHVHAAARRVEPAWSNVTIECSPRARPPRHPLSKRGIASGGSQLRAGVRAYAPARVALHRVRPQLAVRRNILQLPPALGVAQQLHA